MAKCKICDKEYHACGNCGLEAWEYEFCSKKCLKEWQLKKCEEYEKQNGMTDGIVKYYLGLTDKFGDNCWTSLLEFKDRDDFKNLLNFMWEIHMMENY